MQLDHISVPVPAGKIDEARAFYGDVIGLEAIPIREEVREIVAWYRLGTGQLHLIANNDWNPPRENLEYAEAGPHFGIIVESVSQMNDRLAQHGVDSWESEIEIANRKRLNCRDPFGNIIELIELVSASESE